MDRKKIHLHPVVPHRYELEDMMAFCNRYEHLYICGASVAQEYILKYFDNCNVVIDGYAVSNPDAQRPLQYRDLPILCIDDVIKQPGTGVILALPDKYYRHFIPKFRAAEFGDYFTMTEHNKRSITGKVKPRSIDEMMFEINIVDHCNISCLMCDHFSQLSEEQFVDIETFERDMKQMGKLFNHKIACVTLLGGEPTLHENLIGCMKIARREFSDAEIMILTNGLLLLKLEDGPQGNFWQACKDYEINIVVTAYPLNFDYTALEKKAEEYDVQIFVSSDTHSKEQKTSVKTTNKKALDLSGNVGKEYFASCGYFNKWNVLKDGRYYMCPISAHIDIFNKAFDQNLEITDADSLDIYEVTDWQEFSQFSSNRIPFCDYCDLKKWNPFSEWKPSTNTIEEYL